MGKRLGVPGAAVALVALAVGAVSPAWGSSSDKDKQTTFTRGRRHHRAELRGNRPW